MRGRKSKTICVKFREDDSAQMAAWEYLQAERGSKTYGECIAALVEDKDDSNKNADCGCGSRSWEMVAEIRQVCLEIREKLDGYVPFSAGMPGEERAKIDTDERAQLAEIPEKVANLMRMLGGEDEEE